MVELNNKREKIQAELKNNLDKITQCFDILVFEDKTSNIYKMNTKYCQKLLKENITMKYKKH